ncbi:hypothetical protein PT974_02357 [Cladobotryum mycophilum]|uniref:Transmembrane protein n=1 Tax=Cladobotryum mycophilum TaxID=491253 RepID=A0ABR0SXZ6_9HYPO
MAPTPPPKTGAPVPIPGSVISVILSLASVTVLTLFLTQRGLAIKQWSRLPYVVWLVFAIYFDSYLFVFATAILEHSLGVNTNLTICEAAIILCLVFYVTTKLIYFFLVEKAYSIRGGSKPRLKSKLYLFNSFGMLGLYLVVVVLNFIFRITEMQDGVCVIGMRSIAMIPLISFDAVVNVYLTILFLIPLKNMYSFKHMPRTKANVRLRTVAFRTFIGSLCTLTSSIVNLSVLMALNGEPGWVCLMCCNSDILFSAAVVQWVTSRDNAGTISSGGSSRDGKAHRDLGPGHVRTFTPSELQATPPSTVTDISLVATKINSRADDIDDDDDDILDSVERANKNNTSVVVTTTIKHESKPREIELEPRPPMPVRSSTHGYGCPVPLSSGAALAGDARYVSNHTKITAGSES